MREPYSKPKPRSFAERFVTAWVTLLAVGVITVLAALLMASGIVAAAWLLGLL